MISAIKDATVETLPQTGVLVYKRYQNRKLYDTEKSRYVTLMDIYTSMEEGRAIQVVNASTSEDITTNILLAALVEKSRGQTRSDVAIMLDKMTSYLKGGKDE